MVRNRKSTSLAIQVVQSVLLLGNVASWYFLQKIPNILSLLSIIGALIGIIAPIVNLEDTVRRILLLYSEWSAIYAEFEELWNASSESADIQAEEKYVQLKRRMHIQYKERVHIPIDRRLEIGAL